MAVALIHPQSVSKPSRVKRETKVQSVEVCLQEAFASITPATPNRKGRHMNRRSGQTGSVVKKGNVWHGRYYVDLKDRRKRVSVPLGAVDQVTKPQAKRKLREAIEHAGVNREAHLISATDVGRSFEQEAAWWRKNKLSLFKPSCQETMGSHLDKYLLPRFGEAQKLKALMSDRFRSLLRI